VSPTPLPGGETIPANPPRISVVTPTLFRPEEVAGLLESLAGQELLPAEVILVDGAPDDDKRTESLLREIGSSQPFACRYIRHTGGTAIQRNAGIEVASGDLVAFIDDDIRLDPPFFRRIADVFGADREESVGGIVGYRRNEFFDGRKRRRWVWYRRLRLLRTYEPGRYDFDSGYPINANMQPPFQGVRGVDFMTTACAVWRRQVLDRGLRFDPFFRDYGVLEDAHFSLRAGRQWQLLQCGDAQCVHLSSPRGRENRRKVGYKSVVNYYYVFRDVCGPLDWRRRLRFWRFQLFELFRIGAGGLLARRGSTLSELRGRLEGFWAASRLGRGSA
jgi:glycosyltransferase involved in cell wall biosynthesis